LQRPRLMRRAVVLRLADIVCQQKHTHSIVACAVSRALRTGADAGQLQQLRSAQSAESIKLQLHTQPMCRLLSGLPCRVFVWCADCVVWCVCHLLPTSWMSCYCLRHIAGRTPAWRRAAQPYRSVLLLGDALPADAAWRAGSACCEHPWCRLGANPTARGISCSGVFLAVEQRLEGSMQSVDGLACC
jgi:hypothetical protein